MIDKVYEPKPVEGRWMKAWRETRLFASKPKPGGSAPFVIVIPPPNVTGALHLGHALNETLQDILIRHHRMAGREACWVPGTDHGGIATQNVMEKQLKAEGKDRHALGREAFLKRMQEWVAQCKKTILGQLERLGCALDWDREAFTMDPARGRAVAKAFDSMWRRGLIYRGERMVNWCVRCGTALSDIEVEHEDRRGKLWHIRYPFKGGSNGSGLVVATTRPETMLGDTGVAVHPDDDRHKSGIGRTLILPLLGREIPVVADAAVEAGFGTGVVKVTPAHDVNDWEIAQRQRLPAVKVIGSDGRMTAEAGRYQGLSREKAREQVVADLQAQGHLVRTEEHPHAVGVCYRCGSAVEPLLSEQWFVKTEALAAPALEALKKGEFRIYPESWSKPYAVWLTGIRDWCVSRQIWWGHRIPVWYCLECNPQEVGEKGLSISEGRLMVQGVPESASADISPESMFDRPPAGAKGFFSADRPQACPACGGRVLLQDPDVLDTWFSAALWPFSVFGWPDKTVDLEFYYPTTVLVTGYEILNLWVARMQMAGLFELGRIPFPHALIHGIVRDKKGKKMSKSLGNVIDPLDMMDKYGTDALRFCLASQAHPGRDIPFAEESLTGARNFSNKLWNSTRFVLMNLPPMNLPDKPPEGGYQLSKLSHCCLELADQWILAEYQAVLARVAELMKDYEIAAAAGALYGFLWDKFCDWYVELAKIRLQGIDGEGKEAARTILVAVLGGTLKALHPVMPYITEELWQALKPYSGETAEFLLKAGAPKLDFDWANPDALRDMGRVMAVVVALRTLRSVLNVPPGMKIAAVAAGGPEEVQALLRGRKEYVESLARLSALSVSPGAARPPHSATAVAAGTTFYVPLEGVIDFAKERARLQKDLAKAEEDAAKLSAQLSNAAFRARAPKEKVELIEAQHRDVLAKIEGLRETLRALGS